MWILVVPTNCSKQRSQISLVTWRIFTTPSPILPCPCCCCISYWLDRNDSQTHKDDIEEHDAKYMLIKSFFPISLGGRYWIIWLFWELHLHFTPLENLQKKRSWENLQKKRSWRQRRGLCELLRDDCWISCWASALQNACASGRQ